MLSLFSLSIEENKNKTRQVLKTKSELMNKIKNKTKMENTKLCLFSGPQQHRVADVGLWTLDLLKSQAHRDTGLAHHGVQSLGSSLGF